MELTGYYRTFEASRDFVIDTLLGYEDAVKGKLLNELFAVQLLLLCKMLRCHDAIRLLVEGGLSAEAASIAVTEFEVRLDMLYIDTNVSLATQWLQHTLDKRQPWDVMRKINEIYRADAQKRDGNLRVYTWLSQAKHANPRGGKFAFPLRFVGNTLRMSTGAIEDAAEETQAKLLLASSSLSLIEAFESAAAAFARFEPIHIDTRQAAELKSNAGRALREAFVPYQSSEAGLGSAN